MARWTKTLEERFWEKVDIRGDNDCWNWLGCVSGAYGAFRYKGKSTTPQRIIWLLRTGKFPKCRILNVCRNYMCCNPKHLILGTPENRFWMKVNKSGKQDCWEISQQYDYGCMKVNKKDIKLHRYSWELHYGKISDGLCVLHKCDNRKCVNPDHLFLGTIDDNNKDRQEKGRTIIPDNRGERCGTSILTRSEVKEIRRLYKTGKYTQSKLGIMFGVGAGTIHSIVHRKTWKHI